MAKTGSIKWKKILYEKQNYPDNYVDESFLEEMKRNVYTRVYNLQTLVYEAGMVSQQLSSISIFASLFVYMDCLTVSPYSVLSAVVLCGLAGYLLLSFCNDPEMTGIFSETKIRDLKSVILVVGFVFGLSPLLKTLTKTISTDTIYAMTVGMLATNLLLHDYVSENFNSSRPVSLNASVFASVCLASRLPTSWHAFVTVISAMFIFAVMPQIRIKIKERHRFQFVTLTCIMACVAFIMVSAVSSGFCIALMISQIFIIIIFPCWMVNLQKHKNNIHGPWDEAMIKD